MAISIIRTVSLDGVSPYKKGVGAEDSHVKGCIRRGKIRFVALSHKMCGELSVFVFLAEHIMIALPGLSFFYAYT